MKDIRIFLLLLKENYKKSIIPLILKIVLKE